jgi:acyl-CoA dehydrogenase
MEFNISKEQKMFIDLGKEIAKDYGEEYGLQIDEEHRFPTEMRDALAEQGVLGMAIPEDFGGEGLGLLELCMIAESIAENGAGMTPAPIFVGGPVFGGTLVAGHGTQEQKEKYLPGLINGDIWAGGFTEADAGSNITNITTVAKSDGDNYIVNGSKMFISSLSVAKYYAIFCRTSDLDPEHKARGLSIVVGNLPDDAVKWNPFKKMGSNWCDTSAVYMDNYKIPKENLIGPEGKCLMPMFDVLNPERFVLAAMAVGTGLLCVNNAVRYGNQRKVWGGKPISSHQAIQIPLAKAKCELEGARLKVYQAAWLYDQKSMKCGISTAMAKFAATHSSLFAADAAIQAMGGTGYICESHVERHWRDLRLGTLAPITEEMSLLTIAQHDLKMPRSY